jgi:sec-independent protein translocase protein TatB
VFGIDFETLVILAILAFILFGPEKLPEYAAKLGYYIAKLRQASSDLTREYQSSFPDLLQPPPAPNPAPPATGAASTQSSPAPAATPAPSGQPTCPQCATPVGVDFLFCPKCGQLLPRPTAPDPSQKLAS